MRRPRSAAIAAAVSTAVALVAALVLAGPATGGGESVDPATVSAAASGGEAGDNPPDPASLPPLGIQFHGTWAFYDEGRRDQVLDRVVDSGATWVRLDVGWSMLQPTPDGYGTSWAVPKVEQVLDEIDRRGLKVLVMFWMTPSWAATPIPGAPAPSLDGAPVTPPSRELDTRFSPPADPADYARAIGWAAERWGDSVDAWEVWNEPNLDAFFRGTDPTTYAELLCAAYPAVREHDPDSPVVFGGLMFNDAAWLQRAYDAGVSGCFDVMAVHAYQAPADAPPTTDDTGEIWSLGHLDEVRRVMQAGGDDLPVWVTEFGWSVHDDEPEEQWLRGVTEEQQAAYAEEALEMMAEKFPFVELAFWYKDAANPLSSDEHQEGYAMLDEDLRPRLVFDTFRRLYGTGMFRP